MLSKPLAVALLAVGCVAAAGGGAYLAVRQTLSPDARAARAPVASSEARAADVPLARVDSAETERAPAARPVERAPVATSDAARPGPAARAQRPATRTTSPAAPQPPAAPPAPAPEEESPWVEPDPAWHDEDAHNGRGYPPGSSSRVAGMPTVETVRTIEEVVVAAGSVIGLQIETPVSSEHARIEDRVEARVTRDLSADGLVAVPAGTRAIGSVTHVERGGKIRERARLGVRFHTLVLADGTRLPMRTEAIFREGESPAGESAAKIGGAAAGGALLGAIFGGSRGAVVGGAAGAATGTAATMAGERNAAALPAGTALTVRLSAPLPVVIEK